jgi:putative membrane protein
MGWYQGGHMVLMGFWWLVAIAVIVVLAYVVAGAARRSRPERDAESPEQILKRRLASGEIDAATYDSMLHKIRG